MARSATETKAQVEPEDANPMFGPPAPADVSETPETSSASAPEADVDTTSPLTHVVLRPFFGGGVQRVVGEVVDASTWRMADNLVGDRRLRILTREDAEPVTDGQGRFFVDDDALLAFIDSDSHEEN